MATLQLRNGSYRVLFRHGGRRHTFTLGKVPEREAELTSANVDRILLRLEQGFLRLPPGVDVVEFVRNDGKDPEQPEVAGPAGKAEAPAAPAAVTFREFKDRYLETHGNGAMEENSLATVRMHLGHVGRMLGDDFLVPTLHLADLQGYVDRRAKDPGARKRTLSAVTIRKELDTLRAAWNWAAHSGLVSGPFPDRGVVLPKTDEKPPFRTWAEIERRVAAGGLSEEEVADLWDCLYLTRPQVDELLAHVKAHAAYGWVYPMFCFAAHTGARRSEMLRLQVGDLDFDTGTAVLHEKKRARGRRTTRRVPLTPSLAGVLRDWLRAHPGGQAVFCWGADAPRSCKKRTPPMPLTGFEAHHHFGQTLAGGKWQVLRGWHVLRHSFISCLASAGVDQRVIDDLVGHSTEEQRRRYRHLFPDVKQKAIENVFG
jgi:integrase